MISFITITAILLAIPGTLYLAFITLFGFFAIFRLKKNGPPSPACTRSVKLAIVIPAHNEADNIADTIQSIKECLPNAGCAEIIVIADNCSDKTKEISQRSGAEVLERTDGSNTGKGCALNFAFTELRDRDFEFYVVLDADTVCETNFLQQIEQRCTDETMALQVCNLILSDENNPYSKITSIGFYAMNYLRPLARRGINISSGLFGNGFVLNKTLLDVQPYDSRSITEDYEYHLRMLDKGFFCQFLDTTAVHSTMPNYSEGANVQRARWEGGKLSLAIKHLPLMIKKIVNGKLNFIEPALELTLPPISFYTLHIILILVLAQITENNFGTIFGLSAFSLLTIHTLSAVYCLDRNWKSLAYLYTIPKYIFWKVRQIATIVRHSKENVAWVRTRRK